MHYYNFLLNKYKNHRSGIRFASLKGRKKTFSSFKASI